MNELNAQNLVLTYQSNFDCKLEEQLFLRFRGFILGVCKRRLTVDNSLAELESHAYFGAVEAFRSWKPDLGYSLKSYIAYKVRFAIIDGQRVFNNYKLKEKHGVTFCSLSRKVNSGHNTDDDGGFKRKVDFFEPSDEGVAERKSENAIEYVNVLNIIDSLTIEESVLIRERYLGGLSVFEIAILLNRKPSKVWNDLRKALDKVREKVNYDRLSSYRIIQAQKASASRRDATSQLAPYRPKRRSHLLLSVR
jgi:RNA polymerase sigma factor (sigma-70 family)